MKVRRSAICVICWVVVLAFAPLILSSCEKQAAAPPVPPSTDFKLYEISPEAPMTGKVERIEDYRIAGSFVPGFTGAARLEITLATDAGDVRKTIGLGEVKKGFKYQTDVPIYVGRRVTNWTKMTPRISTDLQASAERMKPGLSATAQIAGTLLGLIVMAISFGYMAIGATKKKEWRNWYSWWMLSASMACCPYLLLVLILSVLLLVDAFSSGYSYFWLTLVAYGLIVGVSGCEYAILRYGLSQPIKRSIFHTAPTLLLALLGLAFVFLIGWRLYVERTMLEFRSTAFILMIAILFLATIRALFLIFSAREIAG